MSKAQMDSKLSARIQMAIGVAGWGFISYGFVSPFSGVARWVWVVCTASWVIVHPLELFISIPIGKKAGLPLRVIIFKTLLFGLGWWMALSRGIIKR